MNDLSFTELNLTPKVQRAIDEMGFDMATSIQSQAIPLIRTGVDVIGRSQTGTGKTVAFAIPAIELIDTHAERPVVQVLILCPTRELAQQACEEIQKLTKYKSGIRAVEVYGGVPMDRQIVRLKKANIVIGTPGRVMDHMRRRTLKLDHLNMIVLDEADEMLSMGFKEDIETILQDTPSERQTILFSATMPPAILSITKTFQKDPQIIEINKKQVTLDNISQSYIDAPMGRKMDALNLMLRFYHPNRTMIFCNTKRMVDEISEYLSNNGFDAEGLHGDMKQSQRTKVMDAFKIGKISVLVATDVAARGIDVNDIDYVINYDIPQNTEYYVHRIGRTGRAGKTGAAITICSGRRQVYTMRDIARAVKSEIKPLEIPSQQDIQVKSAETNINIVENATKEEVLPIYTNMVTELLAKGLDAAAVAAAVLQLHFGKSEPVIADIKSEAPVFARSSTGSAGFGNFQKMVINIGRDSRVAPNHIVGAITERTNLAGSDIGKIEIFDDKSIVSIPADRIEEIVDEMVGCKICGRPTTSTILAEKPHSSSSSRSSRGGRSSGGYSNGKRPDYRNRRPRG